MATAARVHTLPKAAPKSAKDSTAEREKRAVGLILTISGIGNRRKVSTNAVDVKNETAEKKTDKSWLSLSKKLIEADELDDINSLCGEIRQYIELMALPSNLKKGIYLLPLEFVEEVDKRLKEYSEELAAAVAKLADVYADEIDRARQRLGPLFNPDDYISVSELRRAFAVTWEYSSFNTPASLTQISEQFYEQERQKAEASWNERMTMIDELMTSSFAELVEHMVKILTPEANGKKKKFHDSSIEKLEDFLDVFNAKNLADNNKLKSLVDQAKTLTKGVTGDRLRSSVHTRTTVQTGFTQIKAALAKMVVDKPKRAIAFED